MSSKNLTVTSKIAPESSVILEPITVSNNASSCIVPAQNSFAIMPDSQLQSSSKTLSASQVIGINNVISYNEYGEDLNNKSPIGNNHGTITTNIAEGVARKIDSNVFAGSGNIVNTTEGLISKGGRAEGGLIITDYPTIAVPVPTAPGIIPGSNITTNTIFAITIHDDYGAPLDIVNSGRIIGDILIENDANGHIIFDNGSMIGDINLAGDGTNFIIFENYSVFIGNIYSAFNVTRNIFNNEYLGYNDIDANIESTADYLIFGGENQNDDQNVVIGNIRGMENLYVRSGQVKFLGEEIIALTGMNFNGSNFHLQEDTSFIFERDSLVAFDNYNINGEIEIAAGKMLNLWGGDINNIFLDRNGSFTFNVESNYDQYYNNEAISYIYSEINFGDAYENFLIDKNFTLNFKLKDIGFEDHFILEDIITHDMNGTQFNQVFDISNMNIEIEGENTEDLKVKLIFDEYNNIDAIFYRGFPENSGYEYKAVEFQRDFKIDDLEVAQDGKTAIYVANYLDNSYVENNGLIVGDIFVENEGYNKIDFNNGVIFGDINSVADSRDVISFTGMSYVIGDINLKSYNFFSDKIEDRFDNSSDTIVFGENEDDVTVISGDIFGVENFNVNSGTLMLLSDRINNSDTVNYRNLNIAENSRVIFDNDADISFNNYHIKGDLEIAEGRKLTFNNNTETNFHLQAGGNIIFNIDMYAPEAAQNSLNFEEEKAVLFVSENFTFTFDVDSYEGGEILVDNLVTFNPESDLIDLSYLNLEVQGDNTENLKVELFYDFDHNIDAIFHSNEAYYYPNDTGLNTIENNIDFQLAEANDY